MLLSSKARLKRSVSLEARLGYDERGQRVK